MPHTAQTQPGLEVPACLTPRLKMDPVAPLYGNSDPASGTLSIKDPECSD